MAGTSSQNPDREERLDEAAAEYLEAVERGERPNRDEWLARYPDLADELREFIADQEKLEGWVRPPSEPDDVITDDDQLATLHLPKRSSNNSSCRIPNFQLISEIARGGMGVVYRARQINLNRIVALKMILTGPDASPAELHRFRMETEAAASLDHPNIMPIYEVGESDGRPFFSMKLMEGGSLAEHLACYEGDERAVAGLVIKIARAVHHAHQRGILHRDLKPANILLDTQGEPCVTDFGLCRRVEVDSGMTISGAIVGTPSYMSPEQAAGRKDLTTATDVYSLGAILYTVLTDRPPFRGDTPLETVRGVLEDEPSRPSLLRPKVDRDLETICLKCLDKSPDRRYSSAAALADDLERWLAGESLVARRSSIWERTWKRTRRNPAVAALVAVSALAFVSLIVAGIIQQNHRISVAEAALANAKRTARLTSEARDHIAEATKQLSGGDIRGAREHAIRASDLAQQEPDLAPLHSQAQDLLKTIEKQLLQEQARVDATESFRRFERHRDDVLFFGSEFTEKLPANHAAAQAAGAAALHEVGLTSDGEGTPQISKWFTDAQRTTVNDGCYELLLVLADVSVREKPPQVERALRLSQRALDFGPATSAYHFCRGHYLELAQQPREAARERELANELPATIAPDHFLRGYDARSQGQITVAIQEFRKAIRIQPKHIWARFFLAACCLSTTPREAESHLTVLLNERPDLYQAYLLRGIAHANLGEVTAAEEDFEHALSNLPGTRSRIRENSAAYLPDNQQATSFRYATLAIRGNYRAIQGRLKDAEKDLLEAASLNPRGHVALLHLAHACERQGREKDAEAYLERALSAQDLTPRIEAGILLYRAGSKTRSPVEALADARRSLEIYPYAEAWVYVADEQLRRNPVTKADYQAALTNCERALASPCYSPETYQIDRTHYLRAHALVELGRHDEAEKVIASYLSAGGKPSAEIHRLRGLIQVKHDEYSSAIHEFSESLVLDPGNPATLAERGSVYLAIGAIPLAAEDFKDAIAKDPKNASALAGRGLIRASRGDTAGAEEDAERAWEYGPRTQRIAWMAARTLAISYGHLDARGRFVSLEEGKSKFRYRDRAVALLEQALVVTDANQQAIFWREAVQQDLWLMQLKSHPRYRELQQKYSTVTSTSKAGL